MDLPIKAWTLAELEATADLLWQAAHILRRSKHYELGARVLAVSRTIDAQLTHRRLEIAEHSARQLRLVPLDSRGHLFEDHD